MVNQTQLFRTITAKLQEQAKEKAFWDKLKTIKSKVVMPK
jgi:hypothetical protein